MINKIQKLADLIKKEMHEDCRNSALSTYTRAGNPEKIDLWDECIGSKIDTKVVPAKKYTKIDICTPQQMGRYMVVNETGEIFGIKAYGVINKLHNFGTVDTIDDYYWGGYRAVKKGG